MAGTGGTLPGGFVAALLGHLASTAPGIAPAYLGVDEQGRRCRLLCDAYEGPARAGCALAAGHRPAAPGRVETRPRCGLRLGVPTNLMA
ncbi:hypothetical protein TPA0908_18850 [Micromonospora sp. AKA38]|nr:hypothetical protein TPA0908_18850 [Micromonospora sp. AKA38]